MKKLFFIITAFCFASIFATTQSTNKELFKKDFFGQPKIEQKEKDVVPVDQGHPIEKHQMRDAYNAPARINTNNPWNFFFWGEFLYWQALQEEMILGKYYEMIDAAQTGHIINMDFDYKPAFKVGLGFHFSHDDWSLLAEYTRYYSDNSRMQKKPNTSTYIYLDTSWWPEAVNIAEKVYGKWNLQMDIIDLDLARSYYLGTNLLLTPYFSMRGAFIDQKLSAYYVPILTTDEVYTYVKSDSWAIGPRVGIDMNWFFTKKFFFYGNAAASLVYTHYKLSHKQYYEYIPTQLDWDYKDTFQFLRPNVEIAVGFNWGDYIFDSKAHLDVFAGYEFHAFWAQNMMKYYCDKTLCNQLGSAYPGNLYLHGLSAGILINL